MRKRVTRESETKKWINIEGRFNVAGVQYSDYQLVVGNIKPGTILKLVGEPYNKFDNLTIRIEYQGIKLGYVPRFSIQQSELWRHHKEGRKCIAVLTSFNKTNPTWNMITVQCKVVAHRVETFEDIDF